MKLITVILTTLLIVATSRAQTCTTIYACDVIINGYCYAFVDQRKNWHQSQDCCVAWGGNLASIHSAGVNSALNNIRIRDRITWIGLNDIASEGNFEWIDGSSYDYNNFDTASGNPSNSNGNEDCVHFFSQSVVSWNDYYCGGLGWNNPTSYICQKKIIPYLDKSRCDLTLNWKCYIWVSTATSWQTAEDTCVEWGGHLASIHSDLENYAVNSIRNLNDWTWIGLSDTATDGVYVWTDGTHFDYSKFAPGEPNGGQGGESCFHLFDNRATWNDYHCNRDMWHSVKISFVCQKQYVVPTVKGEPGEPGRNGHGYPGTKGQPGTNGYGYPGTNGQPGRDGPTGAPGNKGDKGDEGERGITGHPGNIGYTGNVGQTGATGASGQKGESGERGDTGNPGRDGSSGEPGEPGRKGEDGEQGIVGLRGIPGTNGDNGDEGVKGDKGDRGDRGYPGLYATSKGEQEAVSPQDQTEHAGTTEPPKN